MTAPQPAVPQPYPPRPTPPQAQPQDPSAGGARIDEAIMALAEVKDAPPAEQVAPLTRAHQVLRETLDSIGDV